MERGIISASVASLPRSRLGEVQKDHEIWEEYDGGAKFKVTRHALETPGHDEIVALSVSGAPDERQRVLDEFAEVFGEPASVDLDPDSLEHIDVVLWLNKLSD